MNLSSTYSFLIAILPPVLVFWTCFVQNVDALECYVCSQQESNADKCTKTTQQCARGQDTCSAQIEWKIPPYWTPRGERMHFISKGCDSKKRCLRRKLDERRKCKRDWYNDWVCHECCAGDLCNYYVTMGSARMANQKLLVTLSMLLPFIVSSVFTAHSSAY